jgi:MFS family permease
MPPSVRRARVVTALTFFVYGALFANWVTRIPDIKQHVDASDGVFGGVLLGIAVGALLGRQLPGLLMTRYGSGPLTLAGITTIAASLPLIALARDVPELVGFLLLFGGAMGFTDVSMNSHALEVQRLAGKSIISGFHALYSIGAISGAVAGGAVAQLRVRPLVHFALASLILLVPMLCMARAFLPSDATPSRPGRQGFVFGRQRALLLLGAIAFGALLCEGAIADWSTIYLRDNLHSGPAVAASGYVGYSIAMACGRTVGDRLIQRVGGLRLTKFSTVAAGAVFLAAITASRASIAVAGFAALGIGMSVVLPVLFTTANGLTGVSLGTAVGTVSTFGSLGLLAGPPLIGVIAQLTGLPTALTACVGVVPIVLSFLLLAASRSPDRAGSGKPSVAESLHE